MQQDIMVKSTTITNRVEPSIETESDALAYVDELNHWNDSLNSQLDATPGGIIPSKLYQFPMSISSKIPILGFEMEVGASAQEFFSYLVSVDGYMMLDPSSDPDDFSKPIFGPFPLRTGNEGENQGVGQGEVGNNEKGEGDVQSHCQIEKATLNIPLMNRDFVVLNVKDYSKRCFTSVSVKHTGVPGCSGINEGEEELRSEGKRIRVPIIGFYQVLPSYGTSNKKDGHHANTCCFRVFQWIDLNGWFPSFISNHGNMKGLELLQKEVEKRFPVSTSS